MTEPDSTVRRQFHTQKDDGSWWWQQYTSAGVRWVADKDPAQAPLAPRPAPPGTGGEGAHAESPGALTSFLASSLGPSPFSAVMDIGHLAVGIMQVWETRQDRVLREAQHEETRHAAWLSDMMMRWAEVHRDGNHLDLRASEYLAREAKEMMDAILGNKRVAMPQSMLFELEAIQESVRAFRGIALNQFQSLVDSEIDIDGMVSRVLPRTKLNMSFIQELAADPAVEWAERLRDRATSDFDTALRGVWRNGPQFLSRVFTTTELAVPDSGDPESATFFEKLVSFVTPALPRPLPFEYKADAAERRDAFRELALFPAEVSRAKALHSAWLATSAIVKQAAGRELAAGMGGDCVGVALLDPGNWTPQLLS